ncbi:MAG: hypothetical protein ACXVGT_14770 [Oryzihumus sp.]
MRTRPPRWALRAAVVVALVTLTAQAGSPGHASPDGAAPATAAATSAAAALPTTSAARGSKPPAPFAASADDVLSRQPSWPLPADCSARQSTPSRARAPLGDGFSPITTLGAHLRIRRAYTVYAGGLTPGDGLPDVRPCDQLLWDTITIAVPKDLRAQITELVIFDGRDSNQAGELLGEVEPSVHDHARWRLSLRVDDTDPHELLITIAHEIAHLISLGPDQVAYSYTDDECPTYLTFTGCLNTSSMLLTFLDDTWSMPLFREWARIDAVDSDTTRLSRLDAFYDKHHRQFVTPYAVTSPQEDFAESYASWCVDGDQAGVDGADKVQWMADSAAVALGSVDGCRVLRDLARRS